MKKQLTILLILFFIYTVFFIASPVSAYECDYSKGKITSILPATPVVMGGTIVINGYGFGESKKVNVGSWAVGSQFIHDRSIEIKLLKNGQSYYAGGLEENNGVISWTDTSIELFIPNEYESIFYSNVGQNELIDPTADTLVMSIVVKNFEKNGSFEETQYYKPIGAYNICADPYSSGSFLYSPSCNADTWACGNWNSCSSEGQQSRSCNKTFNCRFADTASPATSQSCIYTPPTCTSWTYSDWSSCSSSGTQIRNLISSSPSGCNGGSPILSQSCTIIPACTSADWSCTSWSICSSSSSQTRTCNKTSNCQGGVSSPAISQSCAYIPTCISLYYSGWSECTSDGKQTRSLTSKYPTNCEGGELSKLTQSCTYYPPSINPETEDKCGQIAKDIKYWLDYDKGPVNPDGLAFSPAQIASMLDSRHKTVVAWVKKLLALALTYNCDSSTGNQNQPQTTNCSADIWSCGDWGICSPQGIQTRSCNKTFNCPSVETASPATSQYCVAPNQPKQQTPTEDLGIVNQDSIVKATVKLICPVSSTMASQGSGTVIDSNGTILTNKHVIDGTPGCLVGFINNYNDEPYFGDRQIADIYKISSDADIAILKLRNPNNRSITSIDITRGNSSNLRPGDQITTYGYPAIFGTKIKYTNGPFSGVDGSYLQTTAPIEHGNSGGGAYLTNGTFIGIPTAVVKGTLNSMGYLLSINKINNWINGSNYAYDSSSNNNYSRVSSILENIDLNTLDSLKLFIAENETGAESQKVIAEEKKLMTKIDNSLSKKVSGNILLQVESKGEGWYVNPDNKKKYYLGRPADAFSIMRNLGLGIKHSELTKYLNSKFSSKLSGKILLDVEKNGEAYYVNPKDSKGYFLSRPADAFKVMRDLGLGITNTDIRKIDVGEIK